jgi:coxsackievirus/adenovirus receptor
MKIAFTGAYNSTLESQRRSAEAQNRVDDTDNILYEAETNRIRTEQLLNTREADFNEQYDDNEADLDAIRNDMYALETGIVDLNELVCDKRGDPCDALCGGAGCGHCGNALSCDAGAVAKANNAMESAEKADEVLKEKRAALDDLLRQVTEAERTCDAASNDAQMAYDAAEKAKTESESVRADLQELIDSISQFMEEKGARPADIRAVSTDADDLDIHILLLSRWQRKSSACKSL